MILFQINHHEIRQLNHLKRDQVKVCKSQKQLKIIKLYNKINRINHINLIVI